MQILFQHIICWLNVFLYSCNIFAFDLFIHVIAIEIFIMIPKLNLPTPH